MAAYGFGTDPLRRLSGNPLVGDAPQMSPMPDVLVQQLPQTPAPKPGAWSKDGKAWKIFGILGDALQAAGGGKGTYMPAMLDMQQQVEAEKRFQQQLQQQAELKRMEIEARDGAPTAEMRNFQYYQSLDPSGRQTYADMHRGDPYVTMQLGPDRLVSGPASQIPGLIGGLKGMAGPKIGEVQDGHQYIGGDPASPSSWKPVGGGAGNGVGGFRRPS